MFDGLKVVVGLVRCMSALQMIVDRVRESGVFKRNKVPLEKKVLAALLCFAGLSYRKTAGVIGGISYVTVHRAFIAIKDALPKPERKHRRCIAVDETRYKVEAKRVSLSSYGSTYWLQEMLIQRRS